MRHSRFAGAVIAVTLLLAACGGGQEATPRDESDSASDVVHAAVKETTGAGSAAFEMDMSTKGDVGGEKMDMTAHLTGAYDFESGDMQMQMTATLPGLGETEMEARMVEGIYYMKFPESLVSQMGLPPGVVWLSMDPEKVTGLSEEQMQAMSGQYQDPTQLLAFLEAAGADVEKSGSEEIDGVETTRYDVTATFGDLMEQQSEAVEKMLGSQAISDDMLEGMADTEIPMQVWIDGEGRVRRLHAEMDMSGAMGGMVSGQDDTAGAFVVEMDERFSDFGIDVDVAAPPAAETTDFAELLAGIGQGN